jgi:hypothetical protein
MEIEILNAEKLSGWCDEIDIPEEAAAELEDVAHIAAADETLYAIFCAFYEKTTLGGGWHRQWSDLPFDPAVQAKLKEKSSLFYLLAYLAPLPRVKQEYLRRGISMDIFHATMRDFPAWMANYYQVEGHWGFNQFMWIWRHITCELFCLGRLQYILTPFGGGVTAFRRTTGQQVMLLADPNMPLRADGFALGAGLNEAQRSKEVPDPAAGWRPIFETTPLGWRGSPVSPYGCALNSEVFLKAAEWDLVLQKNDPVLEIHIPRQGALTLDACRDSLQKAEDFFAQQSPHQPAQAYFCHTWFFTPQLQQILPPESNIVRFQREFYLYPFPGSPDFLWGFVFGGQFKDPKTAPRDTSLRCSVLDWMGQEKDLFDLPGVMFHKPGDWGSQPYMSQWDKQS